MFSVPPNLSSLSNVAELEFTLLEAPWGTLGNQTAPASMVMLNISIILQSSSIVSGQVTGLLHALSEIFEPQPYRAIELQNLLLVGEVGLMKMGRGQIL